MSIEIYMNPETGNDSNPGTKELPVKTIKKAMSLVPKIITGPCRVVTPFFNLNDAIDAMGVEDNDAATTAQGSR